jgi:hypothetical protein
MRKTVLIELVLKLLLLDCLLLIDHLVNSRSVLDFVLGFKDLLDTVCLFCDSHWFTDVANRNHCTR